MGALVSLIPLLVSLMGTSGIFQAFKSSKDQDTGGLDDMFKSMMPTMQQMFQQQADRQTQSQPLYDSVMRMAMGGMPRWARGGGIGGAQGMAQPPFPAKPGFTWKMQSGQWVQVPSGDGTAQPATTPGLL